MHQNACNSDCVWTPCCKVQWTPYLLGDLQVNGQSILLSTDTTPAPKMVDCWASRSGI